MKRSKSATFLVFGVLAVLPLALTGCSDDNDTTGPGGSSILNLSFQRLEPLDEGLNYQVWVVEETATTLRLYPVGIFNVNGAGQLVTPVSGTVITGGFEAPLDADDVWGIGITLETSNVVVSIPSYSFLLGGQMTNRVAQMSTDFPLGIGLDLSQVQGRYVLSTPTDEDGENELSGIWFMDPFQGPSAPGLVLPELLDGWDYEGWVEVDGTPLSTGKFFRTDSGDESLLYNGPLPGLPVPGEDFLRNAPTGIEFPLDLSGGKVYITMEPWQQWDVAPGQPFYLRLLEGDIPAGANPNTVYGMTSVASQLPRGTATVE
jgi:hypothetical protein